MRSAFELQTAAILLSLILCALALTGGLLLQDGRRSLLYSFLIYSALVFYGLFISAREISPYSEYSSLSLNLIPFETTIRQIGQNDLNFLCNLIGFIPFGIFLPLIFEKCRKYKHFLFIDILMFFTAEAAQYLFRIGCFDVDDILFGTLGAWIGFLLLRSLPMQKLLKRLYLYDHNHFSG